MPHRHPPLKRLQAPGFAIDLGWREDYLALIGDAVAARRAVDVFNHNLHTLYLYFRDDTLRRMFEDSVVMIDGAPVLWLLRLCGHRVSGAQRMTWVDFIWPLLSRAEERAWRVFYLGNTPDVLAAGLAVIRARLPRLAIAGRHGYFDDRPGSADNAALIAAINDFAADLCIVGMGSPREQYWIKRHHPLVSAPVMLNAGACLEFVAGRAPTAPRWVGPLGGEWLFRFASSPRRFAFRYLVEPWFVLAMLAAAWWRQRRDGAVPSAGVEADAARPRRSR